jgi:hypothetical protein
VQCTRNFPRLVTKSGTSAPSCEISKHTRAIAAPTRSRISTLFFTTTGSAWSESSVRGEGQRCNGRGRRKRCVCLTDLSQYVTRGLRINKGAGGGAFLLNVNKNQLTYKLFILYFSAKCTYESCYSFSN